MSDEAKLVERILWHVEQVCGPLSTEDTVVAGDNDRGVLRSAIKAELAALSPVPASASDAELIARLRAVRDWWRAPGLYAEQAADRIKALASAYQGMREALEPFAKAAAHYAAEHDDNEIFLPRSYAAGKDDFGPILKGIDFHRAARAFYAREALTKSPPQETVEAIIERVMRDLRAKIVGHLHDWEGSPRGDAFCVALGEVETAFAALKLEQLTSTLNEVG